jgi:uncharacterized membrane protein YdcZ (DUF606 family)
MAVILFITGFYSLLIGSKIIIALITSHSKKFISDKWFRRINQAMGIVLFVFAFFLFRNAWQLFK